MTRLAKIWASWSTRVRVLVIGGTVTTIVGAGVIAYLVLEARFGRELPGSSVRARGRARSTPKPQETIKTVDWPLYGYDDGAPATCRRSGSSRRTTRRSGASTRASCSSSRRVVADGILYFQDKDALLYALSADKGKVEWKKQIGALGAASPAYSHGVVFAVTLQKAPGVDQGEALALRAKDGKLLWRYPMPGRSETSPIVVGSRVIVGSESGDIYALDRKTGKVDWHGAHRRRGQGRHGARRRHSSTAPTTPGRSMRSRPSSGAVRLAVEHPGLELRPRRARLLHPGGRLRPHLPRQHRQPRLQLRPVKRRAGLEPHDRRLGVRRAAVADTPKTEPTVYVGSKDQNHLRARRQDRRRPLAASTSPASSSAPPASSARPSTSPASGRTSAPTASTSRPASRSSSPSSASTAR